MRWIPFVIVAAFALVLQSGLTPRVTVAGERPDWILIAVVFFALQAPPVDAVVAGWLLGFSADWMTIERAGFLTLTYTLTAWATSGFRDLVFRRSPVTHVLIVLGAGCVVQCFWLLYRIVLYDFSTTLLPGAVVRSLWAAVYTAMWTPLVYSLLNYLSPLLGLQRERLATLRPRRMEGAGV